MNFEEFSGMIESEARSASVSSLAKTVVVVEDDLVVGLEGEEVEGFDPSLWLFVDSKIEIIH